MDDPAFAELLPLIKERGFLRASETQHIRSRGGLRGRWMLYLWPMTMTAEGLDALTPAMLRLLEPFEGSQIAAHGYGAVPLMTSMIRASEGRLTGMVIRPEAKQYGALRQIDGIGDRSRPVVVVDDSISSGSSFRKACMALESHGFTVEGIAALVDFSARGGREWAEGLGYRVSTGFDVWSDFHMAGPPPGADFVGQMQGIWARERVPDGLDPASAARIVARHYLTTGEFLRPPTCFDREVADPGGAFVSVRRRSDDRRLARKGFWHFDPADADPSRDLVVATVQTMRSIPRPLTDDDFEKLKFGVTFFGELELVEPSDLDFSRYGVVVRSRVSPNKRGGALPNTQCYTTTFEQYRHARVVNAHVFPAEPHEVFRHTLTKYAEPGDRWLSYGQDARKAEAWLEEPTVRDELLRRACEVVNAVRIGLPAPSEHPLTSAVRARPIAGVAVSLYGGGLLGCGVARLADLDAAVVMAARGAVNDRRFDAARGRYSGRVACSVTVLHEPEQLGTRTVSEVARKVRRGRDALVVRAGDRGALYLDSVMIQRNWDREHAARQLLKKAGISSGAVSWTTYKCRTWIRSWDGTFEVENGVRRREPGAAVGPSDVVLLGEHLARRLDLDGWPAYELRALTGDYLRAGTAARCLHALRALADAGVSADRPDWVEAAATGITYAYEHLTGDGAVEIPGHRGGLAAEACLLGAVATARLTLAASDATSALLARVMASVRPEGNVLAPGALKSVADNDLLPGIVLFNLATFQRATGRELAIDWVACREWCLRRARLVASWGLAAWHAQVWSVVAEITGDDAFHAASIELALWMAARQLEADGSYLTDLSPWGAGFHTAFAAEGVSAGWHSARALRDDLTAKALEDSWNAAMRYCDQLVFRREDTFWCSDRVRVLGGVRSNAASSALRVDFTSHTLQALLGGLQL